MESVPAKTLVVVVQEKATRLDRSTLRLVVRRVQRGTISCQEPAGIFDFCFVSHYTRVDVEAPRGKARDFRTSTMAQVNSVSAFNRIRNLNLNPFYPSREMGDLNFSCNFGHVPFPCTSPSSAFKSSPPSPLAICPELAHHILSFSWFSAIDRATRVASLLDKLHKSKRPQAVVEAGASLNTYGGTSPMVLQFDKDEASFMGLLSTCLAQSKSVHHGLPSA